jgi:hypothetical protein
VQSLVLSWEAITCDLAAARGGRRLLHGVSGIAGPVAGLLPPPVSPRSPRDSTGNGNGNGSGSFNSLVGGQLLRADLFAILVSWCRLTLSNPR